MSRYMEVWTYTEDFGVPRWREEWELTPTDVNVKIHTEYLEILRRNYVLLDMEMIQISRDHACVRKLYALSKDGKRDIEMEFIPCKEFEYLEYKYKNAFWYCKRNIHHLEYLPTGQKENLFCQEAKYILKKFLTDLNADIILYKGGHFERDIGNEIKVDTFDITQLGVKKVNSHDPKVEIHLHFKQIKDIVDNYY